MDYVYAKAKTGTYKGFRTPENTLEFLGIKYAQTPLRWKRATKLPEGDGLIDATQYGPVCAQPIDPVEYKDGVPFVCEGALTLNVYTSGLDTKKPVYVYIHGGSFIGGSVHIKCMEGIYCGDQFVKNHPDIVYVNLTYRTGVFGALDLSEVDGKGEYPDSNNLNTLDQMAALEWIHENIEAFGGDPDNITVGGQSAGSYSVTVLMMIPEARKYFKRAILESSCPTDKEMKTLETAKQAAAMFREMTGAKTMDDLLALTMDEIIACEEELLFKGPRGAFSPTRDGRLVPLMPEAAIEEAGKSGIVWLSGTNEGEYDSMMADMGVDGFREMMKRRYPDCTEADLEATVTNYPERDERTALMDLHNDAGMRLRQVKMAEAYTKGGGKVYYYFTVMKPAGNFARCQHCTELAAVAGKPQVKVSLYPPEKKQWLLGEKPDMGYVNLINDIWCNFIRTGDPNGKGVNTDWVPYSLTDRETAVIGNGGEIHMENEPRSRDMDIARRIGQ